jgi:hypothetical protein
MPRIYGEATVTIAAARAKAVNDGFLHDRIIPEYLFELPFGCSSGELGSIMLLKWGHPHWGELLCGVQWELQGRQPLMGEPLDSRAWAMQGRLLSTRILGYGTRQTRWVCCSNTLGSTDGWTLHSEFGSERHELLSSDIFLEHGGVSDESRRKISFDLLRDWHQLVGQHTDRSLAIQKDRLLALAGLAERYAGILGDRYLASLWNSTLPSDLLWSTFLLRSIGFHERPQIYQTPSCSWASVNGNVSFPAKPPSSVNNLAVVDCHIQLSSLHAPFGTVDFGALVVKRPIQHAECKPEIPEARAGTPRE